MSIPIAIATFFLLPDTPHNTRVWYLSQRDREVAIERVQKEGKAPPVRITLDTFKNILSRWKWYMFVLGYVVSATTRRRIFRTAKANEIVIWRVMRR